MSKLDPIYEFVREQLASGRSFDYHASLRDRQSEIGEIAEQLRPAIESMRRAEPGVIVDFENIKQEGRKRLVLTGSSK